MPTQMMVGEVLDDRYELTEIVGEGGMGVVFKAKQLSVNRDVAIKVMKAELFEEFGLVRRFKLEMEIISSLQHPNIVRLLDTGKDKRLGVFFLVMEYIEGVSLGALLYEHPSEVYLKPALAIEIAIQVCSALTEPHRLGVIHRDLKPDNIILMVRSDEQLDVKLLDFGVARIIEPSDRIETSDVSRMTATGGIVGTPPYIAPELCESSRHVSAKSDLYAVGALLFELLTGFPPFQGRSTAEVFYKHVHEPAPLLLDASPVPGCECEDLEELIAKLLAKSPEERPESALHVKRKLDQIRQQNQLPRPTLTYTTKAPTVASFYSYIGTIDDLIEQVEQGPHAHQIPVLTTLPALPPVPRMNRDSKSMFNVDNSSSMEIPRSTPTPEHAQDELDNEHSYTYEMSIPRRSYRAGIWAGVIGFAIILAAGLLLWNSSREPSPTVHPELPVSEQVIITPPVELKEVPASPSAETIQSAVSQTSKRVNEAIIDALQALPQKPTKTPSIKPKTPRPPSTTSPQDVTKTEAKPAEQPSKIKNNIDWLYKK